MRALAGKSVGSLFKLRPIPLQKNLLKSLSLILTWAIYRLKNQHKFYITESRYPATKEYFCNAEEDLSTDTAILIRGPIIKEESFSRESILLYRKLYPKTPIIISTWDYCRIEDPLILDDTNIHIIYTKFEWPRSGGTINLQIIGNVKGLKYAQKLGVKYIISTRADQRIYKPKLLKKLKSLVNHFKYIKQSELDMQDKRLVVSSLDSFKYRLYGLSDMLIFGDIQDVYKYWNAQLINENCGQKLLGPHLNYAQHKILTKEGKQTHRTYSFGRWSEIYIMTEFLLANGVSIEWSLKQYWHQVGSRFIIIDSSSIGQLWPKYSWHENRFSDFSEDLIMNEISNLDWTYFMTENFNIDSDDEMICNSPVC